MLGISSRYDFYAVINNDKILCRRIVSGFFSARTFDPENDYIAIYYTRTYAKAIVSEQGSEVTNHPNSCFRDSVGT